MNMKTKYIAYCLLLLLIWLANYSMLNGQTTSMNYIKSTELMTAVTNPNSINNIPNVSNAKRTTVTYYDGLGRPIQLVTLAKSPAYKDVVQHIEYDEFGRTPKQYLPFTATSLGGSFHQGAITTLNTFYNTPNSGIPTTSVYYSETEFEASPLNRVMRSASPGEAWALDNGHAVGYDYGANASGEVILFHANGETIENQGHYQAGKLFKNTTTDEDGNINISYTDFENRQILKRNVTDEGEFDTYYVYNDLGLLVCVIMPQYFAGNNSLDLHSFRYTYDARKRMKSKKIPGAEEIFYVYNNADLPVFEQDGNLRETGSWRFYKYDGLGRLILSGIYDKAITYDDLQNTVKNHIGLHFEERNSDNYRSNRGYSCRALPTNDYKVKEAFYYDDYDFLPDGQSALSAYYITDPATPAANPYVKSLQTGKLSFTEGREDEDWLDVLFYDERYRLIQSVTVDEAQSLEYYTFNTYSFSGQLTQSKNLLSSRPRGIISYTFDHTYDHDWRPTGTQLTYGGTTQQLNMKQYNEAGQLQNSFLHGSEAQHLHARNYTYNIRGWLTGINSLGSGIDGNLFGMRLYYNDVPNEAAAYAVGRYNGNIAAMMWTTANITPTQLHSGYAYSYDQLNRLTRAVYYQHEPSKTEYLLASDDSRRYSYGSVDGVGTVDNISYDRNGNILGLRRTASSAGQSLIFDELNYFYSGNRLLAVDDNIKGQTTLGDFTDNGRRYIGFDPEYHYDPNGNVTNDENRSLKIAYTQGNNMPAMIAHEGGIIANRYSFGGQKLGRSFTDMYGQLVSDETYYGNLVMEQRNPSRILFEDGYIDLTPGQQAVFNYHLKDHLAMCALSYSGRTSIICLAQ
jgi:hypothetical protein